MINVITDTSSLEKFCASLFSEQYITVDTEFMREKTYYPQLCLVQVAGETSSAVIDPLADSIDLSALYSLLANEKILKVFHACRQDMEIFYYKMGKLPTPLFDTQIAAMACGYGESVSYETLVAKTLGVSVDKSSRFTDWSRRPLSEKQLKYALDDVLHLRETYTVLQKQLSNAGRTPWIHDEMQALLMPETYETNPDQAWQKLRLRTTSPRYLASVQAVARWRELAARARNVPKGRIMKDETLTEVASTKPQDFASLQAIRGFYPSMQAAQYESLFAEIKALESLPSSSYPRLPERTFIPSGSEPLVDLLRLLLKHCASVNQVVSRIIADKEELELLAIGKRNDIRALTGWRYDIFGEKAIKLLEGKIAIKADGNNGIAFIEMAGQP